MHCMEIKQYHYQEHEIVDLYTQVGWSAYTDDIARLRKGFENSLLVLGAYENGVLLGLIRVVGDGYTIVFIQDILVFPQHQRKGVGTALLKEVLERYQDVRQIELLTDDTEKTRLFYESVGMRDVTQIECCAFIKVY